MPDLVGNELRRLSIVGINVPSGGFFPGRLGAEITDQNDEYPWYTESVGDFIWKSPDTGRTIARLVDNGLDGKSRPYKGDQGNVIYAQLLLGATLRTLQGAPSAAKSKLTIILPEGYTCVAVDSVGMDLEHFGAVIPQGRGMVTSANWTYADNKCILALPENGVVHAGSSLFIRITVNNPTTALSASDESNVWTVEMEGAGDAYTSGVMKRTTAEVFKGDGRLGRAPLF